VCSAQSVERLAVANEVADMVMRPGCGRDFCKSRVMIRQRICQTNLVTSWSGYWRVDSQSNNTCQAPQDGALTDDGDDWCQITQDTHGAVACT